MKVGIGEEGVMVAADTVMADEVRDIVAGHPPTRFARGWHCLGLVRDFRDGQPHAIWAFGTKLVVFADSAGDLHVLDGYCRHMGGDLSQGSIKGDAVACPFHDWRWAGNGRCSSIPYARRVPPGARTRSWQTLVRNGQLFVWHDPQGNPPPPEVTIPAVAEYGDPGWTDYSWKSILVDGQNCRELIDNVVDMAHFFYVHFGMPTYFKNVFEGHVASQHMKQRARADVDMGNGFSTSDTVGEARSAYYGPSYMIDYSHRITNGVKRENVLINCHYPVTPTSFMLQYGVILRKPDGMSDEQAAEAADRYVAGVERGFMQDVAIWKTKARIDNPLLCEEDGPVYQLRRWYQQFYVDVEDVTPEMTQRFEYEVDTERANEYWQAEVSDNIANGRLITLSLGT
jgi:3-ketosteroid 9alpha-monooxygenase subunit A